MKADKVLCWSDKQHVCATKLENHTEDLERTNVKETLYEVFLYVWFCIFCSDMQLQNPSLANVIY